MVNTTFFAPLKEIKAQSTAQTHFNIHNAGFLSVHVDHLWTDIKADIVNVAIILISFLYGNYVS